MYNGVDNSKLRPISKEEKKKRQNKFGIRDDKLVICIHGRIDIVKGHDLLIEAISSLEDFERNKIHVIISGNMNDNLYYEKIKQRIEELELVNQFSFIGWCEPQDILAISDLMVQPSRREGFLLSAVEAFFMSVPVIRTYTGGWYDMRECCIGIDVDDIEQLKEEISKFIYAMNDAMKMEKYRQMIINAYTFANSNCSIQIMTEYTRKVFEEIISRN